MRFLNVQRSVVAVALAVVAGSVIDVAASAAQKPVNSDMPVVQAKPPKLKRYTFGAMEIQVPPSWKQDMQSKSDLVIQNRKSPKYGGGFAPAGFVRVVVSRLNEPLRTVVDRESQSNSRSMGKTIMASEPWTMNGKEGMRLHFSFDDGLPAGIMTYVATGETETTILRTYYSDKASQQEAELVQNSISIKLD
jgi:hypothetical protein